jgi:Zn-dependent protease with chaperone function
VRPQAAGKQATCRQCGGTIAIGSAGAAGRPPEGPRPAARTRPRSASDEKKAAPARRAADGPKSHSARAAGQRFAEILEGFSGEFPRPRVTIAHRIVALFVVAVMLVLPVIYLAFVAGIGWLTYWHATHDYVWMNVPGSRAKVVTMVAYVALIALGVLWVLSLIKPLFLRAGGGEAGGGVSISQEPLLYAFADRLADVVGSPRPEVIRLGLDVNASASYETGLMGLRRRTFTLTLGIPLVAGLTLPQLTGIIAHEFGHFSQRGSTFLHRVIRRINFWFLAAVYRQDMLDDLIEELTSDDHWGSVIFGFIAWALVGLGRGVLWCLMHIGLVVSGSLSRRMEFDADRYEIGVVGTKTFKQSSRKLVELTVADAITREYIVNSLDASHLPDNYPAFVAGLAESFDRVKKKAKKLIKTERRKWLTTHPPTQARIDAAERLDLPGIFTSIHAASVLFKDFDKECRELTQFLYTLRFGPGVEAANLRPTQEALDVFRQTMR